MRRSLPPRDARRARAVSFGLVAAFLVTAVASVALGRTTALGGFVADARTMLSVALAVTVLSAAIGLSLGGLAALGPTLVDALLSRAMEMGGAMPSLVVVAVLRGLGADDPFAPAVVVAALRALEIAKTVRSDVRQLREEEFVLSARSSGAGRFRIFRRHLLPHAQGPALAHAATVGAAYVSLDAAVSFVGMGAPGRGFGARIADAARGASVTAGLAAVLGTAACVAALAVLADALGKRHSVPRRFV